MYTDDQMRVHGLWPRKARYSSKKHSRVICMRRKGKMGKDLSYSLSADRRTNFRWFTLKWLENGCKTGFKFP